MTAISITPASVLPSTGAIKKNVVWGGTVTAGMAVYELADGTYAGADCDGTSLLRVVAGIALTGGAAGQPGIIQEGGRINIGGTVVVGVPYYLGDDPGEIVPIGDLAAGDYVSFIGIAVTTAIIEMRILNSGVQVQA